MDMQKAFWTRVRALRTKLRISQAEMAQVLDVSQAYYGQMELHRTKKTSQEVVIKVSDKLGVSPDFLLGVDEYVLEKYPIELQKWLVKKDTKDYIIAAYNKYLQSIKK